MEESPNDNMYVIDFSDIDSASEIIYNLSTVLEKPESRSKKICLKLGNVSLSQAQLLSIKSLISGIGSVLSVIDTKSVETEKVAISLGIIVSNVSEENTIDVMPETAYKMANEIKETTDDDSFNIVEEDDLENNEQNSEVKPSEEVNNEVNREEEKVEGEQTKDQNITTSQTTNEKETDNGDVQDELDVIFGNSPAENSIFQTQQPEKLYDEKEGIADIIVPEQEYTKEDIEIESFPTKYIKQTIRSGQVVNYEGNLVIIGDCHPGCEISAFGDITVWGVLGGIAHAGSGGNQKARVRALKMNAIQLRIAHCYSRRPDSLNTVYTEKTNSFTPEEARIIDGDIVVFKMND